MIPDPLSASPSPPRLHQDPAHPGNPRHSPSRACSKLSWFTGRETESYWSAAGFGCVLAAIACWGTQTLDLLPHWVPNHAANSQILISSHKHVARTEQAGLSRAQIQRSSRSQLSSAPSQGCSQTKVPGLSQVGDRGVGCPLALHLTPCYLCRWAGGRSSGMAGPGCI